MSEHTFHVDQHCWFFIRDQPLPASSNRQLPASRPELDEVIRADRPSFIIHRVFSSEMMMLSHPRQICKLGGEPPNQNNERY